MKNATIEIISEVRTHTNADKLELAQVLGFQCVVQKGLYLGGEVIVYIVPDSLLPEQPWAESYRKYSPSRIKAVKLRGEWSEGIIVPINELPEQIKDHILFSMSHGVMQIGDDVSEILGVTHYEPPVGGPRTTGAGQGRSATVLPYNIPKTDEERFEKMINKLPYGELVDVTLKIDGQSCSFAYDLETGTFKVLGRTVEWDKDSDNRYSDNARRYNIEQKLREYCQQNQVSLCLRGESYGQGIQSISHNPHSKLPNGWAMFSVYNMTENRYERTKDVHYFAGLASKLDLPTVPILSKDTTLTRELLDFYSKDIDMLEGQPFEGVVINTASDSFKIINKHYDSKK